MKKNVLCSASIVLVAACSQVKNPEAQLALGNYSHFVDSIYASNEIWKTTTDTDYVEYATDPNNPTVITLDTIVTMPDKKAKSLVVADYWGKVIVEQYEPLKATVESKLEKMDAAMKKEYEVARLKYEVMQAAE